VDIREQGLYLFCTIKDWSGMKKDTEKSRHDVYKRWEGIIFTEYEKV